MFKKSLPFINVLLIIGISLVTFKIFLHQALIDVTTPRYFLAAVQNSIVFYCLFVCFSNGKLIPYIKTGMQSKLTLGRLVTISLLVGVIQRLVVIVLVQLQLQLGIGFEIGSNQAQLAGTIWDIFFTAGVIAPLYEEFIFRVLFFTLVLTIVKLCLRTDGQTSYNMVYSLKHPICWITLVLSSTIFSLVHGPDLTSFHIYALGGLLCGILYLKHGYLAAVLAHFSFNFLSILVIPDWFFNLFS